MTRMRGLRLLQSLPGCRIQMMQRPLVLLRRPLRFKVVHTWTPEGGSAVTETRKHLFTEDWSHLGGKEVISGETVQWNADWARGASKITIDTGEGGTPQVNADDNPGTFHVSAATLLVIPQIILFTILKILGRVGMASLRQNASFLTATVMSLDPVIPTQIRGIMVARM